MYVFYCKGVIKGWPFGMAGLCVVRLRVVGEFLGLKQGDDHGWQRKPHCLDRLFERGAGPFAGGWVDDEWHVFDAAAAVAGFGDLRGALPWVGNFDFAGGAFNLHRHRAIAD